jgi:signal transduction histidine kinase
MVPLLLVGAILARQSYEVQRAQALELQEAVVRYASRRAADFVYELEDELHRMIRLQRLASRDRDGQRAILSRLQAYRDAFVELALLDTRGLEQMRVSQTEVVTEADFRDRSQAPEFLVPMANGESYYGPVWFDDVTGEPLMTLGMPIVDVRDGDLDGVVIADLRLKEIWDLIGGIRVGETGSAYLVDSLGKVVAHPDPSVVLRGTRFDVPDHDGIQTGLDGTRVILVSREIPLGEQALTLVTERPASEAFALTLRTLIITGVLVSAALAAAGFLGFMIVRQIVRPTMGLAATARALASGDLAKRAAVDRDDELGVLAEAFNSMADQLQKTIGSLERRVAERTRELRRTNEELKAEVAERRRAEAELARSNADLEQFAYVASHDLQEPLRMVTSYVQLLAQDYEGQLDPDADRFISYAVDGANRMKALIDDLLEYSRVGSRAKPFEPTSCDDVMEQVISDLDEAIKESRGEVTWKSLPTVMADGTQLAQLLRNLVGNGIKFRGEAPPHVHVSAALASSGAGLAEAPDSVREEWLFSVRDNGIGIAPKYHERIFRMFERLHHRSEYPGTGIGLAVCDKIVERHGGRIWVESQPGHGSTFYFTIPSIAEDRGGS